MSDFFFSDESNGRMRLSRDMPSRLQRTIWQSREYMHNVTSVRVILNSNVHANNLKPYIYIYINKINTLVFKKNPRRTGDVKLHTILISLILT